MYRVKRCKLQQGEQTIYEGSSPVDGTHYPIYSVISGCVKIDFGTGDIIIGDNKLFHANKIIPDDSLCDTISSYHRGSLNYINEKLTVVKDNKVYVRNGKSWDLLVAPQGLYEFPIDNGYVFRNGSRLLIVREEVVTYQCLIPGLRLFKSQGNITAVYQRDNLNNSKIEKMIVIDGMEILETDPENYKDVEGEPYVTQNKIYDIGLDTIKDTSTGNVIEGWSFSVSKEGKLRYCKLGKVMDGEKEIDLDADQILFLD